MAKVRRLKKNSQKNHINQFVELKRCLEEQQVMLEKMSEQMASQQKVMQLFYKEYQALTKSLDIQHLNNYIRLRDSLIKDMRQYEERNQTNTRGYALLEIYVSELFIFSIMFGVFSTSEITFSTVSPGALTGIKVTLEWASTVKKAMGEMETPVPPPPPNPAEFNPFAP
jgi:ABC-type multidrug transport system fused ATPase/permease subunit